MEKTKRNKEKEGEKVKIIIAGNIAGAGKDTVREYLEQKYNFIGLAFADKIYEIAREIFGMTSKDRKLLQLIGEKMREINEDVWVDYTFRKAEELHNKGYNIVISDLRRENEYEKAIENGFFVVRVVTDRDIAIDRIVKRDGYCDTELLDNDSESGTRHISMLEIKNNKGREYLYEEIDSHLNDYLLTILRGETVEEK